MCSFYIKFFVWPTGRLFSTWKAKIWHKAFSIYLLSTSGGRLAGFKYWSTLKTGPFLPVVSLFYCIRLALIGIIYSRKLHKEVKIVKMFFFFFMILVTKKKLLRDQQKMSIWEKHRKQNKKYLEFLYGRASQAVDSLVFLINWNKC